MCKAALRACLMLNMVEIVKNIPVFELPGNLWQDSKNLTKLTELEQHW